MSSGAEFYSADRAGALPLLRRTARDRKCRKQIQYLRRTVKIQICPQLSAFEQIIQ